MYNKICYDDIDFGSMETHAIGGVDFLNTYQMNDSELNLCVYLDTFEAEIWGGPNNCEFFESATIEEKIVEEIKKEMGYGII